jgi:hypothetical protein
LSYSNYGDTGWQQELTYFIPTNKNIDTSNLYYEVSVDPWGKKAKFRIYFQRQDVIMLADSILNKLSIYKKEDYSYIRIDMSLFEKLKRQAVNNRIEEVIYADELPALLETLRPLVVNHSTNDTPQYLIVKQKKESVDTANYAYGHHIITFTAYYIVNKYGDTVMLTSGRLNEIPLKLAK